MYCFQVTIDFQSISSSQYRRSICRLTRKLNYLHGIQMLERIIVSETTKKQQERTKRAPRKFEKAETVCMVNVLIVISLQLRSNNWRLTKCLSLTWFSFKLIYSLCIKYLLITNMFMKYGAGSPIVNQRGAPAIGAKVIRNSPATQLQHFISRSL